MRARLLKVLIGCFISIVFGFSICSGADSKSGTCNITPLRNILTGAATGATLTVALQGTVNFQDPSTSDIPITGTAKVVADGETTLNNTAVTHATTFVDLTGTNSFSVAKDEYFDLSGRLVEVVKNGQATTPTSASSLPTGNVQVGASGPIATFTDQLGRLIESRWVVKEATTKNECIVQIITTIKDKSGTLLATEISSFFLNPAGIPKEFTWSIQAAKGTTTLSGPIKTQRLGAAGKTQKGPVTSGLEKKLVN